MSVLLSLSLLVWLLLGQARAATFYVDPPPTGSDSRTCTQAQAPSTPRATINQGIACMSSGDTLDVGDGVYNEIISDLDSCPLCRPPSGTGPANRTTLRARNLHGATLIAPIPVPADRVLITLQNSAYLTLQGFILDDQLRLNGANTAIWTDFVPANSANLRFQDLLMRNFRSMGHSGAVTGAEFLNIVADKVGWDGTSTTCRDSICNPDVGDDCHGYCHVFYTDGPGNLWDGGTFSNVDGWVYHGSPGFSNSIIRNGVVVGYSSATPGDGATGGYITSGSNNTVYNNTFIEVGIPITITSANNSVVHNTIYKVSNCTGDCKLGINQQSGTPATIRNNLIVSHFIHPNQYYIYVGSGTGGTGNYLVDNGVPASVAGNVCDTTQAGCQAFSPSCFFMNAPAHDLRLCATSPAISAGVNPGAGFTPDQAGVARPQGGYDAGALEFMTVTPVATALEFGQHPTSTQEDQTIAPPVTVRVVDQFGVLFPSTASITLTLGANPGGSSLSGGSAQAAVGGVATFNALSLNNPAAGYTLVASSSGLTNATSLGFTITPVGTTPAQVLVIQQITGHMLGR